MKIHFVGLGKLGLPVALAIEKHGGHEVSGWDLDSINRSFIEQRAISMNKEAHVGVMLQTSKLPERLSEEVPEGTDIVMIAVQTPHRPEMEGATPLSLPPEDFDYTALVEAVTQTRRACSIQAKVNPLFVIISTCLPGTFDKHLRSILSPASFDQPVKVAYQPLFVAMGQVISDLLEPEFILVGSDDKEIDSRLLSLYSSMYGGRANVAKAWLEEDDVPIKLMSIRSAELTKVAYNSWLGFKLMLTNGLGELSDKVGANVDDVMGALKCATARLLSIDYMDAGMGDGGPCHPRDQIALSWLAEEVGLSHDTFNVAIRAREAHAEWLADIWCEQADESGLQMIMLGSEYKANTKITTGSAARLVGFYATARGREVVFTRKTVGPFTACFFLAVPHRETLDVIDRIRGVMIDPWGLVKERDDLKVIKPGRRAL